MLKRFVCDRKLTIMSELFSEVLDRGKEYKTSPKSPSIKTKKETSPRRHNKKNW